MIFPSAGDIRIRFHNCLMHRYIISYSSILLIYISKLTSAQIFVSLEYISENNFLTYSEIQMVHAYRFGVHLIKGIKSTYYFTTAVVAP